MYKKLTFTKVNEKMLINFLNKNNINMIVLTSNKNLTRVQGNINNIQLKLLLKGISSIKNNKNYISLNMEKIYF